MYKTTRKCIHLNDIKLTVTVEVRKGISEITMQNTTVLCTVTTVHTTCMLCEITNHSQYVKKTSDKITQLQMCKCIAHSHTSRAMNNNNYLGDFLCRSVVANRNVKKGYLVIKIM